MSVASVTTGVPLAGEAGVVLRELGDAVVAVEVCDERRAIARVEPGRLVEASRKLFGMDGARFATATGIDARDGIDVLYHWCFDRPGRGFVVTIKALAERPGLTLDSVGAVIPAANWIEREIHDLLGANFRGHPDMRRLILDDTWPEGLHPLRKDFNPATDKPPLPPPVSRPEVGDEAERQEESQ